MTKRIFCKQAYILDEIRLNMSYDKMTYKQAVRAAVRAAVRDFNSRDWTKECDGKEVYADVYGNLSCGIYTMNRDWCIEVKCDDN